MVSLKGLMTDRRDLEYEQPSRRSTSCVGTIRLSRSISIAMSMRV